jgi:hypothetical protein
MYYGWVNGGLGGVTFRVMSRVKVSIEEFGVLGRGGALGFRVEFIWGGFFFGL